MKDVQENEYEYERRERRTEVACCVSGFCSGKNEIEGSEQRIERIERKGEEDGK